MSQVETMLPLDELTKLVDDVTHTEGLAIYTAALVQLNDGIETINNYRAMDGLTPDTISTLTKTYRRLRALRKVINVRITAKEVVIKECEAINTEAGNYVKHITRTWMV